MKKISQNILTASLGAAIALGGFHLLNDQPKNAKNIPNDY